MDNADYLYTCWAPNAPLGWRVQLNKKDGLDLFFLKGKQDIFKLTINLNFDGVPLSLISPEISERTKKFCFDTPHYTKFSHLNIQATIATLTFANASLHLFASKQGLAYRWETHVNQAMLLLTRETFDFEMRLPAKFLYAYHNLPHLNDPFQNSWESVHHYGDWDSIQDEKLIYLPLTCLTREGALAITEAELRHMPGLNLQKVKGAKRFSALQAPAPAEIDASNNRTALVTKRKPYLTKIKGKHLFPWRIFIFGENPAYLYDNSLPYLLSDAPRGDFSWVKAGRVAWDWWNAWGLQNVPFTPGVNTQTYKYFIDFAQAYNIPYVILDEGWAVNLDITKIIPEIDLPALIQYAKERHVKLILWSSWPQLIDRQDVIFSHYAQMGIAGFKIDFFDRDDVDIAEMLYTTAEIAAKYHLVLAYHGIHKPTGLSRTFPNVLTYEGVFGLENTKWSSRDVNFPQNDLRLAFTRLLAGPTDYTPGAMTNRHQSSFVTDFKHPMSMGTRAHQAALFVLYDTGLQMLCDAPTAYEKEPAYTHFLCKIPLHWDHTHALPYSHPETILAVHRSVGEIHYFAALTGNEARLAVFPLDHLPSRPYQATILRDTPGTISNAEAYLIETREITPPYTLEIPCCHAGGCIVRLTPLHP